MTVPFAGVTVNLGGVDYVVPPLNFKLIKLIQNDIETLKSIDSQNISTEQLDKLVKIIHAALSRNYPDMTIENVEEVMDLSNLQTTIQAVMGVSGIIQKKE